MNLLQLSPFIYFSTIVYGIIVIFDLSVRVKFRIGLKITLLLLVVSIITINLIFLIHQQISIWSHFLILSRLVAQSAIYIFFTKLLIKKTPKWLDLLAISYVCLSLIRLIVMYFSTNFIFLDGSMINISYTSQIGYLNSVIFLIIRVMSLFIIFYLLLTLIKLKSSNNIYFYSLKRWTYLFFALPVSGIILNSIIFFSLKSGVYIDLIASIATFLMLIMINFRPVFLNSQDFDINYFSSFKRSNSLNLTEDNFFKPFFNNHYYLNKNATIEDFCMQNDIQESDSFNEQIIKSYNMSFANLIQKYRIDYFVEIAKLPKYQNYSIESLANEAGFSSRTSLNKPFKKFHGGTPSDYIESINT